MSFNWIDWVIVLVAFYYLWQGWEQGLIYLLSNLASFLGSLWLAIKFHAPVGAFLGEKFGITPVWTDVLGYLIVGFLGEVVIIEALNTLIAKLPRKLLSSQANQWLGAVVSLFNSLLVMAFILLVVLALPLRGTIKRDINSSLIGKRLVVYAEKYGGQVKSALNEAARQATKFLTIAPNSTERINLDVRPQASELTTDAASENRLVELVNQERARAGVGPLRVDAKMTEVARAHSRDMFVRHYFAHVDPDGRSGGDRLEAAGVDFSVAAENLAYAPDVTSAHQGLMESPGHRKNILDPEFHRVGIGVVSGGIYGEMFTQEFAD